MNKDLTPERLKEIEARWKSDVDKKLDAMQVQLDDLRKVGASLTAQLAELNSILAIGKGGVSLTFFLAKMAAALGVLGTAIYALKTWILKV